MSNHKMFVISWFVAMMIFFGIAGQSLAEFAFTSLPYPMAQTNCCVSGDRFVGNTSMMGDGGYYFDGSTYIMLAYPGASGTRAIGVSGTNVIGSFAYSDGPGAG